MRRGDIRMALLGALVDGPAHGYELIGRLEARSGGLWRPSAGSVYPTLQLLEDEGLVRSREDGGKRVYELTDEGRAAGEKAAGQNLWNGSDMGPQVTLRTAIRTLTLAVRQVAMAADQHQLQEVAAILTDARQRIYRLLAEDGHD